MTYACPAREFAAHSHHIKRQRLQNKILCTTGKVPKSTPIRDMHMAFRIPHMDNYMIKLCRQQSQVIQNHENAHILNIGQCEARHRKYKRFMLGYGQAYDRSSS
jgi:hypothetical protein